MFHKPRIHLIVTLSRGNVTKLSSRKMQMLTLHPNENRLMPSNQGDAAQVPTWYQSMFRPNSTLDATRKEVNVGRVQPNMLKSYKGCCSFEILIPLTHLVERARRPTRAPKAVNEEDHQIFFFFCYGSHSLSNWYLNWSSATVYVTSSHNLVGRCACLMCGGPAVRFWL